MATLINRRLVLDGIWAGKMLSGRQQPIRAFHKNVRLMTVLGGWSDTMTATKQIQDICKQAKPNIEAKAKENYTLFEAVEFRKQVVSGMNYKIKIQVGAGNRGYIHAGVYHSLDNQVESNDVKKNKTRDDPINV